MTPPHDHYNDVLQLLLTRLDDLQEGQNRLTDKVDDGFSKMNGRVRKTESDLVKVKTQLHLTGVVAVALAGWLATNWTTVFAWFE